MAKKNKFYRHILYALLVGARGFFLLLPFTFGFRFGGFVGASCFRLLGRERKKILEHLALSFPEKSPEELRRVGTEMFRHYGHTLAELALLEKFLARAGNNITVEGREHFDAALAKGKGVIALTAHFGNWEVLGGYLSLLGYPGSVVARRIYYDRYNELLVGVRKRMKLETLYRDGSPREILRALKNNRVLGIVADQDVETVEGVFADFFGRPAYTPSAPVRFAMTTGAPITPCFIIREGLHHRIVIEPPLAVSETGDKEKDLRENTQKWVSIQERYIRRYPHLWVWNHKRWKTQPIPPVLSEIKS